MILGAAWEGSVLGRVGVEIVAAERMLASALDEEAAFVALSRGGEGAAAAAASCGVLRAFAVEGDLEASGGEGAVALLAELVRELGSRVVVLPADERGGEVGPRLAERLSGTAVTHAVGVEVRDGRVLWTRPIFGGKALATVVAATEPVVATIRRGAFPPAEESDSGGDVEVRAAPAVTGAVELLKAERPDSGASLEDASIVVSGGAGLGDAGAFAELEELAGLLGGAVGASLAAVDNGWAPPERQVGLTGKSVSPDVYFAFGISGASQHLAGIGGARAVVAVNTDADAPIFRAARIGAVTDGRELVAALIAELRR